MKTMNIRHLYSSLGYSYLLYLDMGLISYANFPVANSNGNGDQSE